MPLYSPGSDELVSQVRAVAAAYHRALADAELVVDVLEVRPKTDKNGDPVDEQPLKVGGYPCYATIQINGPKERGAGRGDVLLCVDAYRWPELSEAQQLAILDHELEHIVLVTDADGNAKYDDYDRPKLTTRLHDWQCGWFASVAKRHGVDSIECLQAHKLVVEHPEFLPGINVSTSRRKSA